MGSPNGIKSLIEALDFLSALQAQLEDSPDHESMKMFKYGLLVPVHVVPKGMSEEQRVELARQIDAVSKRQAKIISEAATVVR